MTDHLHALPVGHELGEYRIERVLGAGGFDITCYTWDIHLDKPIPVKESLLNEFALRTDATTIKLKSTPSESDYQWRLERFPDEVCALRADFYFAHPYASWERGNNENTNGLIRQYFPKGCGFVTITPLDQPVPGFGG